MLLKINRDHNPMYLREKIFELSGENVENCIACGKCSSGCAIAPYMDLLPHEIMRLCGAGAKEAVLSSKTIWLCVGCEACTTRCPAGIDIAKVMDTLRKISLEESFEPKEKSVYNFNVKFLDSIRRFGRIFELGFMMDFYRKNPPKLRGLKENIDLGLGMLKKGKLSFKPHTIRDLTTIKRVFEKSRRFLEKDGGEK